MSGDTSGLHEREASFHDRWASETRPEAVTIREAFEAPTALENRFVLRKMGDLSGVRLVDVGAGLGETSVYFAMRGALVTTVDLSPRMVELAVDLGRRHGVALNGRVCPAERLDLPDGSADVVFAANLLHHLTDRNAFLAEARRVLRPGGRFFAWDPLAYNPVIVIYRRMARAVRTEDETPLTFADLDLVRRNFERVGHREFWIASLALFVKYYLVDRVHPGKDRYWKRILSERPRDLWWWYPLRMLDAPLTRIPVVRRLAWNMVVWGTRPAR